MVSLWFLTWKISGSYAFNCIMMCRQLDTKVKSAPLSLCKDLIGGLQ